MRSCFIFLAVLFNFAELQHALVVNSRTYTKLNDNRCLFQNKSLLSVLVHRDSECSIKCNLVASCAMFMLDNDKRCFLYSAMRPFFYKSISIVMPGSCRIFSAEWATCPSSNYLFGTKFYYPAVTTMSFWQAMDYCLSQQQWLLKLDSAAELNYLQTDSLLFQNSSWSNSGLWTSLYGNYSTGKLTWLVDGTTTSTSAFNVYWNIDNCCGSPTLCYALWSDLLNDEGCDAAIGNYHPICTCQ